MEDVGEECPIRGAHEFLTGLGGAGSAEVMRRANVSSIAKSSAQFLQAYVASYTVYPQVIVVERSHKPRMPSQAVNFPEITARDTGAGRWHPGGAHGGTDWVKGLWGFEPPFVKSHGHFAGDVDALWGD